MGMVAAAAAKSANALAAVERYIIAAAADSVSLFYCERLCESPESFIVFLDFCFRLAAVISYY
jgi:hypothetical protein